MALKKGVEVIERHFTILEKKKTKDGIVSANFNQLKKLVNLSKESRSELKFRLKKIKNINLIEGVEKRDLTQVELLNRDYYRGRFASKVSNKFIYNWQKFSFK